MIDFCTKAGERARVGERYRTAEWMMKSFPHGMQRDHRLQKRGHRRGGGRGKRGGRRVRLRATTTATPMSRIPRPIPHRQGGRASKGRGKENASGRVLHPFPTPSSFIRVLPFLCLCRFLGEVFLFSPSCGAVRTPHATGLDGEALGVPFLLLLAKRGRGSGRGCGKCRGHGQFGGRRWVRPSRVVDGEDR